MLLRKYEPSDGDAMAALFYDTVQSVNVGDYTKEQLDVWAPGRIDREAWNVSFLAHYTLVAGADEKIIGFGDIDAEGYLDRLFVHKDYQKRGVATALCNVLERVVRERNITAHVSITARPFFEHRGYRVIKAQQVSRQGIFLTNYVMEKPCKRLLT